MICAAPDLFDFDLVRGEIEQAVQDATDQKSIRKATVDALQTANAKGRAAIAEAFNADPTNAKPAHRAYAYLTDCIIHIVLDVATRHLHRQSVGTKSERLALLAVGGYGRAEMAPHSDVDLLFLTPYKVTAWAESVIESMLYIMWDLHLKVGQSTRTVRTASGWGA